MRRVLQRANEKLGTNYTLHDARHTAATRMAGDERLTLAEVQAILRHAHLDTTGHYLNSQELQQTGEKPQVTSSARVRSESIWPIAHAA